MSDKAVEQAQQQQSKRRFLNPSSRICECGDGRIAVILEMPGVKKEDLEIKIDNNQLSVLGKRDAPVDFKYLVRERNPGDYAQTYALDETVDRSKVDATLDKGILTISLELKEAVKPRTVKIRAE